MQEACIAFHALLPIRSIGADKEHVESRPVLFHRYRIQCRGGETCGIPQSSFGNHSLSVVDFLNASASGSEVGMMITPRFAPVSS